MKRIMLLIGVVIMLTGCGATNSVKIEPGKITCAQKEELMKEDNVTLIDVREENEYDEYHLDKAINIPYTIIVETLKTNKNITKESSIIVYCRSGARSAKAAESLKQAGYTNVYDLGAISNCE